MNKKLKSFLADDAIFTALLLLLIGIISFGLGRQSITEQESGVSSAQSAGVVFSDAPLQTAQNTSSPQNNPTDNTTKSLTPVIGSRSGTKYHLPSCPGVKQMKESNKIFFTSKEEAEAAGYTPAGNCKGL